MSPGSIKTVDFTETVDLAVSLEVLLHILILGERVKDDDLAVR